MKKIMRSRFQTILVGAIGLLMMILVTACAGVPGTSGNTITGAIVSVNTAQHSATLNVNGQQVTVSGLTDQQVTTLQAQVGKTYTLQVTQGSGNSYTINSNSTPELNETNTPQPNVTETTNSTSLEQGNISFTGKVQSVGNNRILVSMPNSQTLSMSINSQTDLSDFNGALPTTGTLVKVKATANTDGSFTASTVKPATPGDLDQNVIDYHGVTISAVGSDRVLHFKVATKSYSFTIGSAANLSDFNNNAQSIGNNLQVKVEVQFNGATGTVIKVGDSNS
jgi:hypothetical protein